MLCSSMVPGSLLGQLEILPNLPLSSHSGQNPSPHRLELFMSTYKCDFSRNLRSVGCALERFAVRL